MYCQYHCGSSDAIIAVTNLLDDKSLHSLRDSGRHGHCDLQVQETDLRNLANSETMCHCSESIYMPSCIGVRIVVVEFMWAAVLV